jgi:hypothetical protein
MRNMILLFVLSAASTGCAPDVISIEVLPPRTSSTCAAPSKSAAATSRGILDVKGTEDFHGAYVGDLRFSSETSGRIIGLTTRFTLPDDASSDSAQAASDAEEVQTLGDLLLSGEDDEIRTAIWEHAVLLPRNLAVALAADDGLGINDKTFATVLVSMEPLLDGFYLTPSTSSYAIDICSGCLVNRPEEESCIGDLQDKLVCRPGQDVPLYECSTASGGGLF